MSLQEKLTPPFLNRRPTHELIADSLRQAILAGQLEPGERLNQEEMAKLFGVSRMPVREALLKLEVEGLVVSNLHKGFAVTELSADEVEDIFTIRMTLEGLATRLAVQNMTQERLNQMAELLQQQERYIDDLRLRLDINRAFHSTIYNAAKRPRLAALITNLRNIVEAYSRIYISVEGRTEATLQEHQAIYEACLQGDSELAERRIREHLQNVVDALVPYLRALSVTAEPERV